MWQGAVSAQMPAVIPRPCGMRPHSRCEENGNIWKSPANERHSQLMRKHEPRSLGSNRISASRVPNQMPAPAPTISLPASQITVQGPGAQRPHSAYVWMEPWSPQHGPPSKQPRRAASPKREHRSQEREIPSSPGHAESTITTRSVTYAWAPGTHPRPSLAHRHGSGKGHWPDMEGGKEARWRDKGHPREAKGH